MAVEINDLKKVAVVNVAYIFLYYAYIVNHLIIKKRLQRKAAKRRREDKDSSRGVSLLNEVEVHARNMPEVSQHPDFIRADRSVLNMLEQMPVFLASLWMYAVFVNPRVATTLGAVYTGLRALYFSLYTRPKFLFPLCTFPQYVIVWYMSIAVVAKAL